MKPTALVFDLDDTLYAERDFVLSGFEAVNEWMQREHGITGFGVEARRQLEAGIRGRIFDGSLQRLGVAAGPEMIQQMVAVYRGHQPRLALFPEARWALENFRGRVKLGLLTDGYGQTQRNKVAALGLEGRFDATLFTDDLGREHWKPSAVPFRQMVESLGTVGAGCIYVGDNPIKDFIAPNGLGWQTVQILRDGGEYGGSAAPAMEPGSQAQRVIHSLRELAELLR